MEEESIDRSFPRRRLYGNEKINWLLDFMEYRLDRRLAGEEKWNRIYAIQMKRKYGMTVSRKVIEKATEPSSWWYDKIKTMSMLYKHADKILPNETLQSRT